MDQTPRSWVISMSGGSLGCLAYASFLQTLRDEYQLQPHVLAGLSGGAMIAPMISAGLDKEEIFEVINQLSVTNLINLHVSKFEIIDHHKLIDFFRDKLPCKTFEDLDTPVIIFATNVKKQEVEVIKSGDLASAIVASCSVYPLLNPVKRLGKLLTDGGYSTYYGAHYLRKNGLDKIVGIDVTGLNEGTTPKFLRSLYLSLNAVITSNSRYELVQYPVDLDIRINVKTPTIFGLKKSKEKIFEIGEKAAHTYHRKIKSLIANNEK